ncbi:MAG: aldo/keto reductase [Gemmatimonadota bacterium]
MTRLALGTAQFGGPYGVTNRAGRLSADTVQAILAQAAEHGIDTLDTAPAYGDAETLLGRAGVASWRVVTKLAAPPRDCTDIEGYVERALNASLMRLRVDRLDGLLLHQPDDLLESGGTALHRAVVRVKSMGLTHRIGVSVYAPAQLSALWPRFDLDMVQLPFNVFDTRFRDSGMIDRLALGSVTVDVRSVFLQGLLLASPTSRPSFCDGFATHWWQWDEWLAHHRSSAARAALGFALAQPNVHNVIIGVSSVRELDELVHAANDPPAALPTGLTANDVRLIDPRTWPAQ